jgi:hypothetical protein
VQTKKNGAIVIDDLIEGGAAGVCLPSAQEIHVPLGTYEYIGDCDDRPDSFHMVTPSKLLIAWGSCENAGAILCIAMLTPRPTASRWSISRTNR